MSITLTQVFAVPVMVVTEYLVIDHRDVLSELETLCSPAHLSEFVLLIRCRPTLEHSTIMSTECYHERSGPVWHRFLIMKCGGPNKQLFWVRFDRRIKTRLTLIELGLAQGIAPANDTVSSQSFNA